MASTAPATLLHPVITSTGNVGSTARIRSRSSKPSAPDVVSRV
jgi:hypothetical protein